METSNRSEANSEWAAIGIAIGTLALGFIVIWLVRTVIGSVDGSVLIALLLLPLIVYEAKFAQAAVESVSPASETVAYDDPQVVAKEGVRSLIQERRRKLMESKPIVMTMSIGGRAQYSHQDVEQYISVLSQLRNFKFVLFLDGDEKFMAYMPSWALKHLLKVPDLALEFLNAVNQGLMAQVLRYPGVVNKTISTKSTNAEALREMLEQNVEALVVIDELRKLRGVVEREQVLSRMMLSMVR